MESLLLEYGVDRFDVEESIEENLYVEIEYMDEKKNYTKKIIEPFLLGTAQNNQLYLRCFLYQGRSISGDRPRWRLLRLDRIYSWKPMEKRFRTNMKWLSVNRREYVPNDSFITNVIARVEPSSGNLKLKKFK